MDNARGMYDVVAHLIAAHGYRRIAFVCGPEEHLEANERRQAYVNALDDHGIEADPALLLPGDFQRSSGARAVAILLDERRRRVGRDVDAIVAANDYMAIGVMEELSARGMNVPGDVALAGFDDLPLSRCSRPVLTSVHSSFYEVGRQGALVLSDCVAGKPVPMLTQVPARAIARQSCGCAGIHDIALTAAPPHVHTGDAAADSDTTLPAASRKLGDKWEQLALLRSSLQALGAEHCQEETHDKVWESFDQTVRLIRRDDIDEYDTENIKQRIISTIDLTNLLEILAAHLPRLGIRCGYLVLYEIEHGETDPATFVNTRNHLIYKNARRMKVDKTLTFALINYQSGQIKIVGQHEDWLVVRRNGQVERIDTLNLGFPIGLQQEISQWITTASATLQSDDGVVARTRVHYFFQ